MQLNASKKGCVLALAKTVSNPDFSGTRQMDMTSFLLFFIPLSLTSLGKTREWTLYFQKHSVLKAPKFPIFSKKIGENGHCNFKALAVFPLPTKPQYHHLFPPAPSSLKKYPIWILNGELNYWISERKVGHMAHCAPWGCSEKTRSFAEWPRFQRG